MRKSLFAAVCWSGVVFFAGCGSTKETTAEPDLAVPVPDAVVEDMAITDAAPPAPDVAAPDVAVFVPPPDAALPDAALPDAALPDAAVLAYSADEVQALLTVRCAGCHVGGMQGGLSLEAFAPTTVRVPALEAPMNRIEPGDHERSYLWHKLNGTFDAPAVGGSGTRMPQGGTAFTAEELLRLALFIDALPAPPPEICDNGDDDDGDRLADCADPECEADAHCQPEDCADGADNDGDGSGDCDDPDCAADPHCEAEHCNDGRDNNLNALVDCDDPQCFAFPACVPEICDNAQDDNGDDFTDCNDDDCLGVEGCMVPYLEAEVQQLFNSNCVGCHVGGQALGGLSLDAPFAPRTVNVPSVRPPLDRIEPGDRARSFLFRKLEGTHADVGGGGRMPPLGNRPLNLIQIERIGLYIDAMEATNERCDNRADDDDDRLIDCADADCAGDPACQIREDCSNGVDDDDDFWVDCQDEDCAGQPGCGAAEDCADNRDNDGDGLIDCRDASCVGAPPCAISEICAGGADEDIDGVVDCADADCASDVTCVPGESCNDGIDNDGDGLVDCGDGECVPQATCRAEICLNQVDDDNNGATDCADAACRGTPACLPENCGNGVDDNGDGLADCSDRACFADAQCQPEDCLDLIDNNGDGRVDCDDPQCALTAFCSGEICDDGVDNDNDRSPDCFDSDCALSPLCIRPMTSEEVQSMFDQSCGCHSGGAPSGGFGGMPGMSLTAPFSATTVNVPANRGDGLDRIEPGDHRASFLWLKIAGEQGPNQGARMPFGGPFLTDVDVERFALFIDQLPR